MSKQKLNLCKKFVSDANNENSLAIVEQLVDLRDKSCPCVYPAAKQCPRIVESPNYFGFCESHLKTKKGVELTMIWNNALEELNIQESDDGEEVDDEEEVEESEEVENENTSTEEGSEEPEDSEEVAESEEEETPPPKPSKTVKPTLASRRMPVPAVKSAPVAPAKPAAKAKASPSRKPKAAAKGPNIEVVKPARKTKQIASAESSAAEGSAKATYVEPQEDEEESPAPLPPLQFRMGDHRQYVNAEHGFVLRLRDNTVLGVENKKTGGIIKLTPKQIEICKQHDLNYLE